MKFENKINKQFLEEALVNWVLGTDGQDGATCEVLNTIPWTNEMEKVTMWCDVCVEIDNAIGVRGDWNVNVCLLLNDGLYREVFNKFIQTKVERIVSVYDKIIKQLNIKARPKRKFKVYTSYCLEVEAETYAEAEQKANENISKLEGVGGNWCWCEDFDAVLVESTDVDKKK